MCYFLSRREADADSSRFLAAIVPQLACLLDEARPGCWTCISSGSCGSGPPNGAAPRAVTCCWSSMAWMRICARPGFPASGAWLPALRAGPLDVLVSSRPRPELPADIPAGHPLW